MQKIVPDSSVIVKWLNQTDEKYLEQSDQVLLDATNGKSVLIAPELAKYEVGNTLLKSKDLSVPDARISLGTVYTLPIQFVPQTEKQANEAYIIALQTNTTFYDASFVALAKQEKATLVTDNPKHQAKIKEVKVVALKDY